MCIWCFSCCSVAQIYPLNLNFELVFCFLIQRYNNPRSMYQYSNMAPRLSGLITNMKKLLDSDRCRREVQFKCNTSAKCVTQGQKVYSYQCKLCAETFNWERFSQMRKNDFKKDHPAVPPCDFLCLKKSKMHSPKRLMQFQLFEKLVSWKIILNWTRNCIFLKF